MSMAAVFFNLLANAAFSMAGGMLVVGFFLWLFRVETGPWRLFLLSLPFVKIVYDSVRGLPPDSILLNGLDPFSLPARHQTLQLGVGFSSWAPEFNLIFSVRDIAGKWYAASIGDYLVIWLNRTFGCQVPLIILDAVLAVSAILLVMRGVSAYRFEKRRKADRAGAKTLRTEPFQLRTVDIYISRQFSGTPFTGGVMRPYICIPQEAFDILSKDELEAVIAHELGHIRQIDLVVTIAIQLLGDLFWFVPGYRWLSRKMDRLREIVADQWAVRSGVEPALLASALLKLKEISETSDRLVLYSAFFREQSLLKVRVEHLLGKTSEKRSRFGWSNIWFRSALSAWIFTAVMVATVGGNQQSVKLKNPKWFNSLFQNLGQEVINIEGREK